MAKTSEMLPITFCDSFSIDRFLPHAKGAAAY